MRRFATLALAVVFALAAVPVLADAHSEKAPSLYQRLGGYDALAAATDDFIGRLASDPELSKFFAGHSKDSLARIRQLVVDPQRQDRAG